MDFPRIKRLPPYVFNVVGDLKQKARRAGEDIIDFSMGNPDGPTPPHIVAKLIEASEKPSNHRYSVSRGVYKLRVAIADWYKRILERETFQVAVSWPDETGGGYEEVGLKASLPTNRIVSA